MRSIVAFILFLTANFTILSTCQKDSQINSCNNLTTEGCCTLSKLKELGMHPYTGKIESSECHTYLFLYFYKNKAYYQIDNPCADIIFNPVDCEGARICDDEENEDCFIFLVNAIPQGTIGIKYE